jgi:hypothetical protein
MASKRKVVHTKNPKLLHSTQDVHEDDTKFINSQNEIQYRLSPRLAKYMKLDRDEALKQFGWIDTSKMKNHVDVIKKQLAHNEKIEREYDILRNYWESLGSDNVFYLPWGQTIAKRFTLLTDLNYQESKMHREYIIGNEDTATVDITNSSLTNNSMSDNLYGLKVAIMQAIGGDPDKLSPETVLSDFNNLFTLKRGSGVTVNTNSKIGEVIAEMLANPNDTKAVAELFAKAEGYHGITAIDTLIELDKALKNNETEFTSELAMEVDAITSGMILTMLQVGVADTMLLAEKGGIYTSESLQKWTDYVHKYIPNATFTPGALIEAGKIHAAELEDKIKQAKKDGNKDLEKELSAELAGPNVFKDLYSTVGIAMVEEVKSSRTKLESDSTAARMLDEIGDLNLKNVRNIVKWAVMTYNYGSTIGSIMNLLTNSLAKATLIKVIEEHANGLERKAELDMKNDITEDEAKELKELKSRLARTEEYINGYFGFDRKYVGVDGRRLPDNHVQDMEIADRYRALDINDEIMKKLKKDTEDTFGKGIKKSFKSTFGEIDNNRNTIKAIELLTFEAYDTRLKTELSKIGVNKTTSTITKNQKAMIESMLLEQGFAHNATEYVEGKKNNYQPLSGKL